MSDLTNYNSDLDNFDEDFMSILKIQKKLVARQKKQEVKLDRVDDTANYALGFAQYAARKAQDLEGQQGYYSVKKVDNLIGDIWQTGPKRSDISGELRELTYKYNRRRIKLEDANYPKGVWGYDPYIIRIFLESKGIPVPEEILYAQ
tara:strand:- start:135 stop:575 length:441 start_codon:yes stop_codon:yes gene_type:complete